MADTKAMKGLQTIIKPQVEKNQITAYFLVFAIAFAVFILGPPFLGYKFSPYPLMQVADILDLFTPLILIPLYWLLFRLEGSPEPSVKENLFFMCLAGLWVLGQGMHLAANSIGNLLGNYPLPGSSGVTVPPDIITLTKLYDETLSHYLWHLGVIGLSAVTMYRQWYNPQLSGKNFTAGSVISIVLYGFTYFAMIVEGVTWPMGIPLAVLLIALSLARGRKQFKRMPLLYLFMMAYLLAMVLIAVWGIWQGGIIEFSQSPSLKWLFHK